MCSMMWFWGEGVREIHFARAFRFLDTIDMCAMMRITYVMMIPMNTNVHHRRQRFTTVTQARRAVYSTSKGIIDIKKNNKSHAHITSSSQRGGGRGHSRGRDAMLIQTRGKRYGGSWRHGQMG